MVEVTVIGRNSAGDVGWSSFGIKLVTPFVSVAGVVEWRRKRLKKMQRSLSSVFDLIKSAGTPSGPAELSLMVFRTYLSSSRVIFSARASRIGGMSMCRSSGRDGLSNFDLQKSSMVLSD